MRRFKCSEPGALLGLLAATLLLAQLHAAAAGARVRLPSLPRPCLDCGVPGAVWIEALAGLRLEFFDPESSRTYTAQRFAEREFAVRLR